MRLRPRQVWGAGVLVAAVGLLALVALASEDAPFDVKDDLEPFHGPGWPSVILFAIAVVVMVWVAVLVLSANTVRGRAAVAVRRRRGLLNMLVSVVLVSLLLWLLRSTGTKHDSTDAVDAPPDTGVEATPSEGGRDPGPPWAAIVLGGTVLVVLAAAAATRRHMIDDPDARTDAVPADAAISSVSVSLDALTRPGDDRAAIVAAYAALLDGLASAGIPRRSAEAPEEYIGRVLSAARRGPGTAARADGALRRSALQRTSDGQ